MQEVASTRGSKCFLWRCVDSWTPLFYWLLYFVHFFVLFPLMSNFDVLFLDGSHLQCICGAGHSLVVCIVVEYSLNNNWKCDIISTQLSTITAPGKKKYNKLSVPGFLSRKNSQICVLSIKRCSENSNINPHCVFLYDEMGRFGTRTWTSSVSPQCAPRRVT